MDRPPDDIESKLLDLEVGEDGGLRLFCGRASDTRLGDEVELVIDGLIIGLTKRLVLIARVVADTADYLGSWDLEIAVTRLRGLTSLRLRQHGQEWAAAPFSEADYRQTARVTHEQLGKDPDAIVAALAGRLSRALGRATPIPQ